MSQSSARNTGIREGNSEIICFLDSDMVVNKNWILTYVDILSDKKIVGVVGDQISPKGEISKLLDKYLYDKRRGARQFKENVPITYPYFLFSNASLKRSVFNTIDIFDEKFNSYGGEDTELAIRLWEAFPTSLRYSSLAISENYGNQKFEDFCEKMYQYGQNNFLLLIKKHPHCMNNFGGKYINSVMGYIIFNPISRFAVYLLGLMLENYWLTRYLVVDSVIRGARKAKKRVD
jgi:GT2 family glycosyltransferase